MKKQQKMFLSSFCQLNLNRDFSCTFFLIKKNYYLTLIFTKFMWLIQLKKISKTVIKSVKNQIFINVYLPLKPSCRSCFFLFHSHDPKPKQNQQISSTWAKIRSTRSQACVKYRGNIICIKRNTDVNTGDLKILHKKCPINVDFPDIILYFSKIWCGCLQPYSWLENYGCSG